MIDAITLPGVHDACPVLALPLPSQAMAVGKVCFCGLIFTVLMAITAFPSIQTLSLSRTLDFVVWTGCQAL